MGLAKTTRPSQAGILVRSRLVRRLDLAGKKPVTWVWAPPGAGKATLVASYLAARKTRGLWYQVDEGEADVATFFYYLGLAAARRRRPLPLLTPEYHLGTAVFARRFFCELYSRLKPPFTVVFDNYQDGAARLRSPRRRTAGRRPPHANHRRRSSSTTSRARSSRSACGLVRADS